MRNVVHQRATTSMATGMWSKIMCHVVLCAGMLQRGPENTDDAVVCVRNVCSCLVGGGTMKFFLNMVSATAAMH